MVASISQTVVNINTTIETDVTLNNPFFNDPFFRIFGDSPRQPRTQVSQGIGDGFIVSADGYVITNEHVVDQATKIAVTVDGFPEPVAAKVVGADQELDLAVLKLETNQPLSAVNLGDSATLRPGEWWLPSAIHMDSTIRSQRE